MKKINWSGITAEAVTGVVLLLIALINAVLQMLGYNTLPFVDAEISEVISGIFVIATALYNTWKNRNATTASQKAQAITDAIKNGELLVEDVDNLLDTIKNK